MVNVKKPTKKQKVEADRVTAAKMEILAEDEAARLRIDTPERRAAAAESMRRASLPSEDKEHICGMSCDGQDGSNSYCARLRRKLGLA